MGITRYYAEPPIKSRLIALDGTVAVSWLSWFALLQKSTKIIVADANYDPPSIAAGATARATMTVNGARAGDFAVASFTPANTGITLLAQVTSDDTVTVTFWNVTGGAIDLAAGTLRVRVEINA